LSLSLVCGLGNPDDAYARTRHNLGFMVLERLGSSLETKMRPGKGEYLVGQAEYLGRRVYLVKPLTYVNQSGVAVSDAVTRYDVALEDLLVICDDCELPFGRMRLRKRGSHGGHRGLESVIYHLRSEDFPRLRIGIERSLSGDLADYVLSEFEPEERDKLPKVLEEAEKAIRSFLELGVEKAMSLINRRVEVE
jgi:PTH1 family peptidyl-tRNA hydrolase